MNETCLFWLNFLWNLFHCNTRVRVSCVKGCGYATGQLWPIWPNLANLMGKLQTTFFQLKCLNSDWYYIEVCFKGVLYTKTALVWLIAWSRASDKPLSDPMLTQPLTHIYAALWGNVLTKNRFTKVRQKSYLHILTKKTTWNQQMTSHLKAKQYHKSILYNIRYDPELVLITQYGWIRRH